MDIVNFIDEKIPIGKENKEEKMAHQQTHNIVG